MRLVNTIRLWSVPLILFLIPWQTHYVVSMETIEGDIWPFGIARIFLVEVLVLLAFLLHLPLQLNTKSNYLSRILLIGLLLVIPSVLLSSNTILSVFHLVHLVSAAVLFLLLIDNRQDGQKLFWAFIGGLIIPLALGFIQFITGENIVSSVLALAGQSAFDLGSSIIESDSGRWLRAYGSFEHANVFGGYIAAGLTLIVGRLLTLGNSRHVISTDPRHKRGSGEISRLSKLDKIASILLTVLFSAGLIISFSRSAWLAYIAALLVGGFVFIILQRISLKKLVPGSILAFLAILLSSLIFFEPIMARLNPAETIAGQSVGERQDQYELFTSVFNSFFVGLGPGAYTYSLSEVESLASIWEYQPIHNTILLFVAEVGFLGALGLLFWIISIDRINYKAISSGSGLATVGMMIGTIILILALFDHYLWSSWAGLVLLCITFGFIVNFSNFDGKKP